jgi:hypothetical protein
MRGVRATRGVRAARPGVGEERSAVGCDGAWAPAAGVGAVAAGTGVGDAAGPGASTAVTTGRGCGGGASETFSRRGERGPAVSGCSAVCTNSLGKEF